MDILFTIFIILLTVYATNLYFILTSWKRKRVPYKISLPFLGSYYKETLGLTAFCDGIIKYYNEFPNKRYFGTYSFNKPTVVIRDLELIKKITVKDFDHFVDHQAFFDPDLDPYLGRSLLLLRGQKWKDMRSNLSPVFTSSKLKGMFGFITNCAEQFTNYLLLQDKDVVSCEMKECFTKFANDVIATTAFGINCDSFKNPDNDFYAMGRKVSNFGSPKQAAKFILSNIMPKVLIILDIPIIPKKFANFFRDIIINNMRQREKENIVRPDLVHLLMEMKKGKLKHDDEKDADMGFATVEESNIGKQDADIEITDDLLVSQAILFFLAGFDTVSTALCFCVYELALNIDIQERLQREIDEVMERRDGKVTYEDVAAMKYLDMVFSGSRFALLEAKIVLIYLLSKFSILVTDKTQIPLKFAKGPALNMKGGCWLGFKKRD